MTLHLSPSEHHRYLTERIRPSMRFRGNDVRKWRARLLPKLAELLGDRPDRPCPLKPNRIWRQQHELGTIEKVSFASEPFSDVVAYVCIPKGLRPPYPFSICLQGHTTGMHHSIGVERLEDTKPMAVEGDRDFGLSSMRNGMAALCIEQRSFGLRRERKQEQVSKHGCHDAAAQALLLGRTLLGERVYDVSRGIDYLSARGDADMNRVGIMGNSGGGVVTIYAAALLRHRIAWAMPSCSFCTFRDSILSIDHCIDNFIPGLYKYAEMADVMGLFAPKPLLVVAGKEDTIFPLPGVRRAFRDLRRIYKAYEADSRCQLVLGNEGHRFYAATAWPALRRLLAGAQWSK